MGEPRSALTPGWHGGGFGLFFLQSVRCFGLLDSPTVWTRTARF
jgi:hypothetical protein